MLKKIAAGAVVVVAGVLIAAATRPDTLEVRRSTTIKAPPEKIYPFLADFHNWSAWSPYDRKDPAMQKTCSGAPEGVGAVYEWKGNSNVGSGRMEITDATPPSHLSIKLDFITPFEGHNQADFSLQPEGEGTTVTWTMRGPSPFIGKLMGLFINMDKMVGGDFEVGLANLKRLAEK